MPLSSGLLIGELFASLLIHMAIPILVGRAFDFAPDLAWSSKIGFFIAACVALSFVVQTLSMVGLQASACAGVKNGTSIIVAGAVGALITACLISIPIAFEPMRLVVSQIFAKRPELTPAVEAAVGDFIKKLGGSAASAIPEAVPTEEENPRRVQLGGDRTAEEAQTFKEIIVGSAYWAAAAGAYGIGIGSMLATTCPG